MRLLYIADNGFSYKEGKYYCTTPNHVNLIQYGRYFSEIVVIARECIYQNNSYEVNECNQIELISKNDFFALFRKMKKLRSEYDIVLMRNGINGCFASMYSSLMSIPYVAYCGSDPYEFQIAQGSFIRKIYAIVWRSLERFKMKHATYAQYCTEYLFRNYPTKAPYLICSNVEIDIDDSDLDKRIAKIKNKNDKIVRIGMIGRIDENKGVRTIICALAELEDNFRFELIGGGNPDIFIEDIKKLEVGSRIQFLGYWSDKQKIKDWLRDIDVYVQPSLSEGLPRSTIEAMSVGCPCVATNIAGLPDILQNEFLINPKDFSELAQRILYIVENQHIAIKAAKDNFGRAKDFDRKVRDRKLDEFYGNIVCIDK